MNQLKVIQQQTIMALHQQGWSKRRVAREFGVDRKTVRRYLAKAAAKSPTNPQTGSEAVLGSKPPTPQTGALALGRSGTESLCEPWKERIQAGLAAGLSVQRIYQDLVTQEQFAGSYYSVRRLAAAFLPPLVLEPMTVVQSMTAALRGQPEFFPQQRLSLSRTTATLFFLRCGHAHHAQRGVVAPRVAIQFHGQLPGVTLIRLDLLAILVPIARTNDVVDNPASVQLAVKAVAKRARNWIPPPTCVHVLVIRLANLRADLRAVCTMRPRKYKQECKRPSPTAHKPHGAKGTQCLAKQCYRQWPTSREKS